MQQRRDYGIDSPARVAGELIVSGVGFAAAAILYARGAPRPLGIPLWAVSLVVAAYLLLMAGGMLFYSLIGKRAIRDWLLDQVPWRGDEVVLDVGCGRGLLLVGAAQRVTSGKAIGVVAWNRGAVSGNRPAAALRNARLAGVPAGASGGGWAPPGACRAQMRRWMWWSVTSCCMRWTPAPVGS